MSEEQKAILKAMLILVFFVSITIISIVYLNINENLEMAKIGLQRCSESSWKMECEK